jgi:pimeloyl-ACP methyl ester carboxylesterase
MLLQIFVKGKLVGIFLHGSFVAARQTTIRDEAPTQLIWADQDRMSPPALATLFKDRIPGAQAVTVSGSPTRCCSNSPNGWLKL